MPPSPTRFVQTIIKGTPSGSYWVTWANANAVNSNSTNDLKEPFRSNLLAFIKALEDAGATVQVSSTKRSNKRAYLFHWSWKIYLQRCKPSDAPAMDGVDIAWDHGDDEASRKGAGEMVKGFGLAIPPASEVAPSLTSNHITGLACDMKITWIGNTLKVKKKNGDIAKVTYYKNSNLNTELHKVGKSYGVIKHTSDEPHWSHNGR